MRDALADRIFDVIGEVLSLNDVNLPDILREAANDPRRLDEYLDQIERVDPAKLMEYEKATGIALARANVDFSVVNSVNPSRKSSPGENTSTLLPLFGRL